jgi:hypothetical protein
MLILYQENLPKPFCELGDVIYGQGGRLVTKYLVEHSKELNQHNSVLALSHSMTPTLASDARTIPAYWVGCFHISRPAAGKGLQVNVGLVFGQGKQPMVFLRNR